MRLPSEIPPASMHSFASQVPSLGLSNMKTVVPLCRRSLAFPRHVYRARGICPEIITPIRQELLKYSRHVGPTVSPAASQLCCSILILDGNNCARLLCNLDKTQLCTCVCCSFNYILMKLNVCVYIAKFWWNTIILNNVIEHRQNFVFVYIVQCW